VRRLARDLGVDPSLPSNWHRRRDKRGNAGLIPQTYHKQILELAAARGVAVTAEHLVHGGPVALTPATEPAAG